ncbi:hypothetical protein IJ103_00680 [Candidatus Saccharibacteria bacterium]|nr:hypothetical protein [Candidatus Saccharibacteria bacterium]
MWYFSDLADEAMERLATQDEDFVRVRKDGYDEARKDCAKEFEGLSPTELETRRHEHRSMRKVLAEKILYAKDTFAIFYTTFSIAYDLWHPLILVAVFCIAIIYLRNFIVIGLTLLLTDMIVMGVMIFLMGKQTQKLIGLYKVYGVADGLISLADYRKLEQIDLSHLPSLEEASGEETWYL